MPNLVKKSHLQDVALNLWNKIQSKLNGYVHQSRENMITGKTVLFDGYVSSVPLLTLDNPRATYVMNNNTSYFVCSYLHIRANQKVGQVMIGVNPNKQAGEIVTGVNIGAIKTSNREVLDFVILNGNGVVQENTDSRLDCEKVITVDVNFTWDEDVYLIVGGNGVLWGPRNNIYGGSAMGGGTLPSVGSTLALNTGNYVGKVVVYGDVVALRDLANSGAGGVSREEFEQHVTDNEQQHQELSSNITANTQSISSNSQRISNLEGNVANKSSENVFIAKNTFMGRSPIVDKYFSIKHITGDGIHEPYSGGTYCCNPKEGITSSALISALLLPIHNSRPGDTIQASYFTFNAQTGRVTGNMSTSTRTYTVQDIEYQGVYCIVFNINQSFNYPVGFGFRVDATFAGSRRISLLKQDMPNIGSNNAYSFYNALSDGNALGTNNGKYIIPYAITQRSQSEVVTRFDLANNTVPLNIYQVGELKAFAFDLGESTEIGDKTWIRCEGQTVNRDINNNILKTSVRNTQTSITLPVSEEGKYIYVCAY